MVDSLGLRIKKGFFSNWLAQHFGRTDHVNHVRADFDDGCGHSNRVGLHDCVGDRRSHEVGLSLEHGRNDLLGLGQQ
jgi:hypothetical protein